MSEHASIRRFGACVGAWLMAALLLASAPIIPGAFAPAQAQAIKAEFRVALEPYGRWETLPRWGEVWVPSGVAREWRPYTVGHWVYTDDWGWYWASDEAEDAWGWITYHYGRWVHTQDFAWVWVPGQEWGPAWVQWRRGAEFVGWAPLPPDDVIVEYADVPDVWIFCRSSDFLTPRIATVLFPVREYDRVIRETVIVNRTVVLREQRFAVNPGIAPAIIAASVGRPFRSFTVQPRVLAGTARIPGAVEVRAQELRQGQRTQVTRESLRESNTIIRPAGQVPPPQPLASGEQGRLGDNPPRAAQRGGGGQPTTGQAPREQGQQQRPGAQPPQGTQGRGAAPEEQRQQQGRPPQGKDLGKEQGKQKQQPGLGAQPPQGTQGRGAAPEEQRQQGRPLGKDLGKEQQKQQPGLGRGEQPKQGTEERRSVEPKGVEPKGPSQGTQGRGSVEPRQPQGRSGIEQRPGTEGRGGAQQPRNENRAAPQQQRTMPQGGTEGRGGGGQPQRSQPQQQRSMPQGGTEGRGGGQQKRE